MQTDILPPLALLSLMLLSSCTLGMTSIRSAPATPLTTAELAGKWKTNDSFYIIIDEQEGIFSASRSEEAADSRSGILGSFSLEEGQLRFVEDDDSVGCPGAVGHFEAVLTQQGELRLTMIEDECIPRIEGLFNGGEGGHSLLYLQRVK